MLFIAAIAMRFDDLLATVFENYNLRVVIKDSLVKSQRR